MSSSAGHSSLDLGPDAAPGWGDLFSGRNGIFAAALAGGVALHAVNTYIATTVMPSVVREIGGLDFYAWATTLFVTGSIIGAALTARLLARFGPRGAYLTAAALFFAGTLLCSVAPSMPVMLAGRSVQGLGGGFLYALSYALTRLVLPERLWGRTIGLVSAMYGIAALAGPAVGGIFAELGSWRAAFWSLLPFAALLALVAVRMLPRASDDAGRGTAIPFVQLTLLVASVLTVSAAGLSQTVGWQLAGLGAGLGLVALIAVVDAKASARLLPRRAFNPATALGAVYALIALLMLAMQPEIFVPYLLQVLHAQSPLWAGYFAALMAIGWSLASLISGRWQEAHGNRLLPAGTALTLCGLGLLTAFLPHQSGGEWAQLSAICLGILLVGFGIGLAWPSVVTRVYASAPAGEEDLATGGMTMVQLFAIAFGTALAGMLANMAGIADPGGAEGASRAALLLGLAFALAPALGLLVALRVVRLTGGRR